MFDLLILAHLLTIARVDLMEINVGRGIVVEANYCCLNDGLLCLDGSRLLAQVFVFLLLVLVWLQYKWLTRDAHDVLFWVKYRILVHQLVILVGSKHWLLHNSNHSIWALLRKRHLLLFFSHCILLDEGWFARAEQIAWHVIECRVCKLVHVAEGAANILFWIDTDINQIRLVLLVIQIVISALAATLSTCILSVILTFVSAC